MRAAPEFGRDKAGGSRSPSAGPGDWEDRVRGWTCPACRWGRKPGSCWVAHSPLLTIAHSSHPSPQALRGSARGHGTAHLCGASSGERSQNLHKLNVEQLAFGKTSSAKKLKANYAAMPLLELTVSYFPDTCI